MKKITAVLLPFSFLSLVVSSNDAISSFITGTSSVYVVYQAGDGVFADGTSIKSFQVRRGIKWNRRSNREKPLEALVPEDEQVEFDGTWTYEDKELTDDTNNFVIDHDMVVTAKYVPQETTHIFENDSWYVLSRYSLLGLDAMKTNYNVSSFIGLKRKIKVAGQEYSVTVIGENADPTAINGQGQYSNPAPLTFQFDDLIDPIAYTSIDEINNNYTLSNLRRALNHDIFDLIEKGARNNIREVYKRTNVGGGSSVGRYEDSKEKLFALSLKEMNADAYISSLSLPFPESTPIQEETLPVDGEPTQYAYYHPVDLANLPSLAKYLLNSSEEAKPYWTRSPEVESSYFTWHISNEGKIGVFDESYQEQAPEEVTKSLSVAPCFAY